jgi:hypothetical protein
VLQIHPGPNPLNRMEVSVRTDSEYDQFPSSQMSSFDTYIGTDSQGCYKGHEVNLNVNVESGLDKV